MRRIIPAAALMMIATAALADNPPKTAPDMERAKAMIQEQCIACHSEDGNSVIGIYPSIASQHPEYIFKQAVDIRDKHREWGMASAMQPSVEEYNDSDLWSVSVYLSQQPIKPQEADPKANLKLGESIYRGGIAATHVPACMSCHGPNGAGIPGGSIAKDGITAFPRLSSQQHDYVMTQMNAFKSGERQHNMMTPIAKRMTEEEMEAVSAYILGLH